MQADYFAFIASAYGISALAILGLAIWVFLDARTQRGALKALEAQGIRRRSQAGARSGSSAEAGR
ncbi:heme exporter protein CcmD [Aurantimonas sp. 22II-16-19i]|uniref:heme exporter protein CcmD n=1 Tax=Aurantimonas sp. 22II-16-19i TaxID=1317114 RepID=UPI0009F7B309|nr:heme exporter protein CcmD [Aurantimonas sp. 22II-16-19i]ORE93864.1 heme exporter protein CcmD [Aurantimonas sp. 22II-16-19i]